MWGPVSLEIINFALFIKEIKVLILIDHHYLKLPCHSIYLPR